MDNLDAGVTGLTPRAVKTRKWDVGSVEDELGERTIYRETESSDSSGRVAPRVAGDSNADRSHARVPRARVLLAALARTRHTRKTQDLSPCAVRMPGHARCGVWDTT